MAIDERKTVLITGTSAGGIGNALAREFHTKGLRVFATARNIHDIEDLSALGIETLSLQVHVPDSIQKLKEVIDERTGGRLDILINNAGRNYTMPALDLDLTEVEDLFNVNVFSVMRMCKAFSPLIIRAGGIIVQIGSLSGFMPHVFGSAYNASKAALHSYTNCLRVELKPFGARAIIIYTGGVQSRIARQDRALPGESLYLAANEGYIKRLTHSQQNSMTAGAYAKSVVSQLLVQAPKSWIWEGSYVWLMWIFWTFMPRHFLDNLFSDMFGLKDLSREEALAGLRTLCAYED